VLLEAEFALNGGKGDSDDADVQDEHEPGGRDEGQCLTGRVHSISLSIAPSWGAAGGVRNPVAAAGHGRLLVVEVHKSTASSSLAGTGSGLGDLGAGQPSGGDRDGQEGVGAEDQGAGCGSQQGTGL
jgi:hypothetical protein